MLAFSPASALAMALGATDSSYYSDTSTDPAATLGLLVFVMFFYLLIFVVAFVVAGLMWAGVFRKAGYAKWKAFVPFYNTWILVKIAGRPESHFWLQFIPYAGIYWGVCTLNDVAKSFGKDTGFTVGLVFIPVVFASILSYGDAQYRGPSYMTPEQRQYAQQYGQQYGQVPYQAPGQYDAVQYAQPQTGQYAQQQYQGQEQYGQQESSQYPGYGQSAAPAQPPYAPQYPNGQDHLSLDKPTDGSGPAQ